MSQSLTITVPADYTVRDTERRLNVCHATVYALIKSGELKSYKIGRSRRILASSIDSFIARQLKAAS